MILLISINQYTQLIKIFFNIIISPRVTDIISNHILITFTPTTNINFSCMEVVVQSNEFKVLQREILIFKYFLFRKKMLTGNIKNTKYMVK